MGYACARFCDWQTDGSKPKPSSCQQPSDAWKDIVKGGGSSLICIHKRHTHTHPPTHTHTHTHTHTLTHTHTHAHTHVQTASHNNTHTCIHGGPKTQTETQRYSLRHTQRHMHDETQGHAHTETAVTIDCRDSLKVYYTIRHYFDQRTASVVPSLWFMYIHIDNHMYIHKCIHGQCIHEDMCTLLFVIMPMTMRMFMWLGV